ncbi:LOW QUALITY PROTEIN: DNA-directed RNA polymerase subunit beta C-terminal section [Frankliniella fusca]|uniref:DNA-directed RNA polymerase subunit beta C-terminal section n=1 Tax=Frankliniella fusca TaxID=407009 RepID=A0AAE1LHT8_9NEOP|nr:LOW QUALITY PROTEIN: DNA-directed RNA polymerase subunit beta C-terminal section [Frankliniella fusca]
MYNSGARFKILNYQIFHAKFGCTFCYHETFKLEGKYTCWSVQDPPAEIRTDASLQSDLHNLHLKSQKTQLEVAHRGVKGPCSLMELKHFSVAQGFVVDYMHAICVGCVKEHLVWMLHPKLGKRMWIGMEENRIGTEHLIKVIDKRMSSVQSSTSVFRHLRKLSMHANWKAREYLLWIVFYAVPCLTGLMKEKYLLHLSLLSAAINNLLHTCFLCHKHVWIKRK